MCHFDDDNYVNIPQLRRVLRGFDASRDWYLGRPSTRGPIDIDFDGEQVAQMLVAGGDHRLTQVHFWFATGGAGFCLSRSLLRKLQPYVERGRFEALADRLKLPDDVALGFALGRLFMQHVQPGQIIPGGWEKTSFR